MSVEKLSALAGKVGLMIKLRWYVEEVDHGPRPDWPRMMSLGKRRPRIERSVPVLQYFLNSEWVDVPVEVKRLKSNSFTEWERDRDKAIRKVFGEE